jgi:hypothetical protein
MVEKVEFAPTFTVSRAICISIEAYAITIWLGLRSSFTGTFTDTEFYVWSGLCRSRVITHLSQLLKLASQKMIGYEFKVKL